MILSKIFDVVKELRSFISDVNIAFSQKFDTPEKRKSAVITSGITVLAVVLFLILDSPTQPPPPPAICAPNSTTAYGQRYLLLDDGSEISLEAGSELCYNSQLNGAGYRNVILFQGRAYFEIQHDAQHPFIIMTPQGVVITVRGTGLAVNVNEGLKTVDVAVTHGVVDVRYKGKVSEITTGQQISIDLATKDKHITSFDPSKTTHLSFNDVPLATVARVLEQRFYTSVRFEKEALKRIRVSGDFANDDVRLRHILRSLEGALTSFGIEFRLEGTSVVIREKR